MLWATYSVAQSPEYWLKQRVGLSLDSVSVLQWVTALERQTGCYFYFDAGKFDTVKISINVRDVLLEDVLKDVLHGRGYGYACDPAGHIFITTQNLISIKPGTYPGILAVKKKSVNDSLAYLTPTRLSQEEHRLWEVGSRSKVQGKNTATVDGYVKDNTTGEGIANVSVTLAGSRTGVTTDQYGYFSFTLPKGEHTLKITCLGMADTRRHIRLYSDGKITVYMTSYITSLREVKVIATKSSNVRGTILGVQKLSMNTVKQLPALMGEADMVRALQLLPGVTSVGEGSTGLNVRGGSVDQNLVLYDGATIYNPSHFFGFFSGFNPDLIKDAELYKSSIPVRYTSRLSSVLDVVTREGNNKKMVVTAGVGPLSGHVTIEGPMTKKTSYVAGFRSTYANWLLSMLDDARFSRSRAGFYDANLRISHESNEKNSFYLTLYNSNDRFKLDGDTLYKYGNSNAVFKWKHNYNNRCFSVAVAGIDYYKFSMERDNNNINDYRFSFDVQQYHGAYDLTYIPSARHRLEGGISSILYTVNGGRYEPVGKGTATPVLVPKEQALESALYLSDQWVLHPDLTLNVGLRANLFQSMGSGLQYDYAPGTPRDVNTAVDSFYAKGIMRTWGGLEPRVALRYMLNNSSSIKIAYNRTRQNIHLLTNTTAVSPTDTWKLSDRYMRPQVGDQYAVGYYHNLKDNTIEISLELYYKRMRHLLTYKNGATLLLNPHIETALAAADGKAYGTELLLKKTAGKLTGWFSYTWSRTLLKVTDPLVPDPANGGQYFPADYDKPHIVNLVGTYRVSHRFSLSLTSNYSTGRPVTVPVARYYMAGSYRMYYADRNKYRIPDYFRTDFSINIEGNHRIRKLAHSSWTLGLYNLTARRNPYSVFFESSNGVVQGYKLSIFGSVIPFITYNVKF